MNMPILTPVVTQESGWTYVRLYTSDNSRRSWGFVNDELYGYWEESYRSARGKRPDWVAQKAWNKDGLYNKITPPPCPKY